ncbi:60S RIBOSOMAL PROTEIN L18A-LIKE [Salix purpurea]|uniref:60S RIBOSOMAL PROTEIN L18A-LIKE n=1 Tax=Salix purpurea TaxID=77065 RepID=A0A9Q1A0V7_SALPP|nr:60S RIBOSOMAL PROTEIN L18A-LIKE [Salix purpurea]
MTMSDQEKNRGVVVDHCHHEDHPPPPPPPPQFQYGTFQGVANYPQPYERPVIGFPQPVPPPGITADPYAHGYQTVPGYAVAEGRPVRHRRLPCCGCGVGWFLFIIGFFLGGIPWYVGLFIIACMRIDHREKPGYVACTIAAILATFAIILGATKGADEW